MKPSIGRIVHFVQGGVHFAAIVTKVWTDVCVNLYVLPNGSDVLVPGSTDGGQNPNSYNGSSAAGSATSVVQSTSNAEFSWHWPERDE